MKTEIMALPEILESPPVTEGAVSFGGLDDQVLVHLDHKPPPAWFIAFAITSTLMTLGMALIGYTIATGIGVWGNNIPVAWAFDIINFVFWVGIGHAGTLISAILLLFRARWRNAISRFAEAMTIFAVMCAGLFPAHSCREALACILAFSVSEPARHLAELPLSSDLGRVRGEHLFQCLSSLLVPWPDPRLRLVARSDEGQDPQVFLRHAQYRLARRSLALADISKRLT